MTSPRDRFLQRVRHAVRAGNRMYGEPELPPSSPAATSAIRDDIAAWFVEQVTTAGGMVERVANEEQARQSVIDLVRKFQPRRVGLGRSSLLERLQIAAALEELGFSTWSETALRPEEDLSDEEAEEVKRTLFDIDISVTGVAWLIAETGSIVVTSEPGSTRSLSLLPPVHIAVAERSQILPRLADLPSRLCSAEDADSEPSPPSCVTLITGPSKTGDIELRLVTGVHGPGELHVVLIDAS